MAASKSVAKRKTAATSPKRKAASRKAKPTRAVQGKAAGKAIDAYVERSNSLLAGVALAVRRLVKKTVPAAVEALNPWGVPVFELNGAFCLLMVGKDHVTFGFTQGASIHDPDRLLEGTGKNIRHIKLKKPEQVNHPGLRRLVQEAAVLNDQAPINSAMRREKSLGMSTESRSRWRLQPVLLPADHERPAQPQPYRRSHSAPWQQYREWHRPRSAARFPRLEFPSSPLME